MSFINSHHLSGTAKFGYGIGDFAFNVAYQVVALYLLYFFTDVFIIGASTAGTIFLIAKAWDAISDPLMGTITDRTRSRWGQKRPYILFGAFPLALSVFLLFASPDFNESAAILGIDAKVLYAGLTFILFCTAITVVNVPYGSLTASLTVDSNERSSLSGYRMTCALLGTLCAAGATKPIVLLFDDETTGFRMMGAIYAALIIVILIITFFSVKERVAPRPISREKGATNIHVILKNKPFIILTISTFLFICAMSLLAVIVNYYFKYNLQNEGAVPIAFLILFVTAALCMPGFVFLSKRRSKRFTFLLGMAILACVLVLLFFFGEVSMTLTYILLFFAGIGISTVYLCPWSMIPDTVEYSQWKTGLRREGILYGCFFFCFKLGTAIAGFFAGKGLEAIGYVANQNQSETVLFGIRCMLTLAPTILIILGMIVLKFYSIDRSLHQKMLNELGEQS